MSLRPDGAYRCDRCDADVDNAGVLHAAAISDLDGDTVRVLHLCRSNGCTDTVLDAAALAAYHAWKDTPTP